MPKSALKRKAKALERMGAEPSLRTKRRKRLERNRFYQWAEKPSSSETDSDSSSDNKQSQHTSSLAVRIFATFCQEDIL